MGFEQADKVGFWEQSKREMAGKMHKFNQIWDELGLPVSNFTTHLNCTFAASRLRIPSPRRQSPTRLQTELVPDHGSGRCCHTTDGILHAWERTSRRGLFAVRFLQERRCLGNGKGAVEESEEVHTRLGGLSPFREQNLAQHILSGACLVLRTANGILGRKLHRVHLASVD